MSKKPRQNDPRKPVVATSNPDAAAGGVAKPGPASLPKPGPGPRPAVSGAAKPRPEAPVAAPLTESAAVASGPAAQAPAPTPKQDAARGGSDVAPGQPTAAPDAGDIRAAVMPEPKPAEKDAPLPSEETRLVSAQEREPEIPEAAPKPPSPRAETTTTDAADSAVLAEQAGGSVPESSDEPTGKVEALPPEVQVAAPAQPGDASPVPAGADAIVESKTRTVSESADAPVLLPEETDQLNSVEVEEAVPESLADAVQEPGEATPSPHADDAIVEADGGTVPESVPTPRPSGAAYKALAFVLEVALLGAAGLWAIGALPFAPVISIAIVAIPLIVFWAVFMSPQAALRFRWPVQPIVAHLLFAAGTGLLFIAEQPVMGAAMGFLTLVSIVLTLVQRRTLLESGIITPRPPKPAGRRAAR